MTFHRHTNIIAFVDFAQQHDWFSKFYDFDILVTEWQFSIKAEVMSISRWHIKQVQLHSCMIFQSENFTVTTIKNRLLSESTWRLTLLTDVIVFLILAGCDRAIEYSHKVNYPAGTLTVERNSPPVLYTTTKVSRWAGYKLIIDYLIRCYTICMKSRSSSQD